MAVFTSVDTVFYGPQNRWGKRGAKIKKKIAKCVILRNLAIFLGDSNSGPTGMLLRDKELHLCSMCLTASED